MIRRLAFRSLTAFALIGLLALPLRSAPPTPVPAAKPPTKAGGDAKSAITLLKQGQDALLAQDYKAALGAFLDALSLDLRSLRAMHGVALAHMYLGDFTRASTYMERTLSMSGAKPDRAVILNYANLQIALNNPMRALKLVKDYIEAHPKEIDEPMLNALGSSLFLADPVARRNPLWSKGVATYENYQNVIEANPSVKGRKRWGVEWLSAGEVSRKLQEMRNAEQATYGIGDKTDKAEDRVFAARAKLGQVQTAFHKQAANELELTIAQGKYNDALAEFNKLAAEYDAAVAKIVRPTFPRVLTPVAIDDITPPATGSTNSALAMADPVYQEALVKASKPSIIMKRAEMNPEDKTIKAAAPVAPPPAVVAIKNDKVTKVRVTQYAAAFAVSEDLLITAAAPLENAVEFEVQTIDGVGLKAKVVRTDAASNLALLKLTDARKLNFLTLADATSAGAITCVCFPTVNLFNPTSEALAGTALAPTTGTPWNVRLSRHPRLIASPLVVSGKVVGAVMASREAAPESLPAIPVDAIRMLLGAEAGKVNSPHLARDPASALLQLVATREVENK